MTIYNTVSIWKDPANTVDGRIPAPPHAIVKPNGKLDVIEYISISLHQQPSDPDSVFCKGGCWPNIQVPLQKVQNTEQSNTIHHHKSVAQVQKEARGSNNWLWPVQTLTAVPENASLSCNRQGSNQEMPVLRGLVANSPIASYSP